MRRSSVLSWLLICLAASLSACGSAPDTPQSVQAIVSWSATAQMIARRWYEGSLPTTFTRRALESVQRQLAQARHQIENSHTSGSTLTSLSRASARAERTVIAIDSAISRRDTTELLRRVAEFARQRRALDTLDARSKAER